MMEINCTLILQMLHFGLAYLILKYLVFKPALAILHKRDTAKIKLEQGIAEFKQSIATRQAEDAEALQQVRVNARQLIPSLVKKQGLTLPVDQLKKECLQTSCSEQEIDTELQQTVQILKKQVQS